MRVDEIAPGLWRWTGKHPGWSPAEEWPQEVGCVYFEAPDAVVLLDPLIPPEDRERFLEALDRDVERAAKPVVILLTTDSHARSRNELAERYGAGGEAPAGVETKETTWYGELLYWLPAHRAVVTGDVMLGDGAGGVRLADEWLGDDRESVRKALLPLLDAGVERILVTHGEPVVTGGHEALERALHSPPSAA
jgi:hypothetical protein